MATSYKAILVKARPWAIGVTMVGLLLWNMKQCDSINKEHDTNNMQNKKIAAVGTIARGNSRDIQQLVQAIGQVDEKVNNNSDRISDVEDQVSELTDSVDSLRARVDSIKPCRCPEKKAAPVKAKKHKKSRPAAVKPAPAVKTPAPASTVNINNGTINNYYSAPAAPAPVATEPAPKKARCVSASVTVEVVHTTTVTRGNCR